MILLWFEFPPSHQSRNKITIDFFELLLWFPLPFHFQRNGRLGEEVELSGVGAGWTFQSIAQDLDAPVISASLSSRIQGEDEGLFL